MISHVRKHNNASGNNRLNFILTIIFLMGAALIFRLYNLQVFKHDLYQALASGQHQIYNKLEPLRGRILIQDSPEEGTKLYPVATNKDFALIYAIPPKIGDAERTAEELYKILDEELVIKEASKMIEEDEYFKVLAENEPLSEEERISREEFKEIKKELEIKNRKEKIMADYKFRLSKKNDPYEPIKDKVGEEELKKIIDLNIEGLEYIMNKHRYYPENNIGSQMIGFLGFCSEEKCGQYGLEGFFNDELKGKPGVIKADKSAGSNVIIINNREYSGAVNGSDLVLTVNRSIQYTVHTKLREAVEQYGADSGSAIVMDPRTGAIIAMCSWPNYDPNNYNDIENIDSYNNPVIFEAYEPGSIFKVITMAAGIDQGKISPDTVYEDKGYIKIEGWPEPIKNSDYETHGAHGIVDMVTVLEESLNTGSIFIMEQTGAEIFSKYVKDFGFGEKTGIELETEGISNIQSLTRKKIRPVEAATASFGQGITATPLQIITAFGAVINGGILMKPYIVKEIRISDGNIEETKPIQIRRVISERTSLLVSGMMVNVVEGGHATYAKVPGYYVGGKTGTAQVADRTRGGYSEDNTIHTFVGFAPAEDPQFVMLVKFNKPSNVRFAASSAAPLFGEIAEFILNYYKVFKTR